ncbi:MAG: molecular chaperone TorD family protein [Planctomycetes bacterium]|nr:molecular chaperone TorD family protein [Planctomycetota bacterium]
MVTETQELTAADLAFARAAYYRFLARAFAYPRAGAAADLRESLPEAPAAGVWGVQADAVGQAQEAVRRAIAGLTDEEFETSHIATYGHSMPEAFPPHETRYGSTHPFQESQDLADVSAFYAAFGLRVRPGTGERVDHAWLELEFVHFLAVKQLVALDQAEAEGAARTFGAAKLFLRDHLGRWGPVFADLLSTKSPELLTQAFGQLLGAVLRADLAILGVKPGLVSPLPIALPPEPEPDEVDGESTAEEEGFGD